MNRNTKAKLPPLPPSCEWDFRQIDDETLPAATLWEFARSTSELKDRTLRWLRTEIDGVKIREHLLFACKKYERPTTIFDNVPVETAIRIDTLATESKVPEDLFDLIVDHRPDFPRPWLEFPIQFKANSKFSRVLCIPIQRKLERLDQQPAHKKSITGYYLKIDWDGATTGEIIKDIERWIRAEAKRRGTVKLGAPTQAQAWKLKSLAAFRLRAAKFSYSDAQKALRPFSDAGHLVPTFKDPGDWSDACNRAKAEIDRLEKLGF